MKISMIQSKENGVTELLNSRDKTCNSLKETGQCMFLFQNLAHITARFWNGKGDPNPQFFPFFLLWFSYPGQSSKKRRSLKIMLSDLVLFSSCNIQIQSFLVNNFHIPVLTLVITKCSVSIFIQGFILHFLWYTVCLEMSGKLS